MLSKLYSLLNWLWMRKLIQTHYNVIVHLSSWCSDPIHSNEILISIEVFSTKIGTIVYNTINIDFVSQGSSDTTESLYELETFLGLVWNELNFNTEMLVIDQKPITECFLGEDIQVYSSRWLLEPFWIVLLPWSQIDNSVATIWVFDFISVDFDIFKEQDLV